MATLKFANNSAAEKSIQLNGFEVARVTESGIQIPAGKTLKAPPSVADDDVVVQSQVFGVAQTWQNMIASRAFNINYTNATPKPIIIMVSGANAGSSGSFGFAVRIDGVGTNFYGLQAIGPGNMNVGATAIIPPGSVYTVDSVVSCTLSTWAELRS